MSRIKPAMVIPTREEEKAARERTIFIEFAEAAGLLVQANSVSSERPPKPDIRCVIDGEEHYFELGEVVDEGFAARLTQAIRTMLITGGFSRQDAPLLRVFEKKAQTRYETRGSQLELIIYYDRQIRPPDGALQETTQQSLNLIAYSMLLEAWSRLWLYDATAHQILWMVDQSMV